MKKCNLYLCDTFSVIEMQFPRKERESGTLHSRAYLLQEREGLQWRLRVSGMGTRAVNQIMQPTSFPK